jgi:tetratricopeptide (TPR) repeat protein
LVAANGFSFGGRPRFSAKYGSWRANTAVEVEVEVAAAAVMVAETLMGVHIVQVRPRFTRTDRVRTPLIKGPRKPIKHSFLDDPSFKQGYRAAYDTIYDRHDYASAIDQLKALGHDDYGNVANLIGYSYRKLGDYKQSQVWYERALKSDPNHVLTWNYYGFWQIEQGNRDQAEYHLSRIAAICGTDCAEYRSLAAALEQPPGTSLVY